MTATETLPIGEVAQSTGVSVSAVRYYDELGLVRAADRIGGKRRFDSEAVGRINFTRWAQDAGFSLDEIMAILDDSAGGWHELVRAKRAELSDRRDHLSTMIELLEEIEQCGCSAVMTCDRANWLSVNSSASPVKGRGEI